MRSSPIVVLGLLALGCSGSPEPDPRAKPTSGDEDIVVTSTSPGLRRVEPRRAQQEDLSLSVIARSPIGPLQIDHVDEYPIVLQVQNDSSDPIRMDDASAFVSVMRDMRTVRGCEASVVRRLDVPSVVAPNAVVETRVALPCPLVAAGEYDVLVTLVVGPGEDLGVVAPTDVRRAASTRVVVDSRIPPFASSSTAPAEIYPPGGGVVPITRPENLPEPGLGPPSQDLRPRSR